MFAEAFAPEAVRGNPAARQQWAVQQLRYAAQASRRLGLAAHATFSGALLWPYLYPWPQRPAGLVEQGFDELARRWLPILDEFDRCGVDVLNGKPAHRGGSGRVRVRVWLGRARGARWSSGRARGPGYMGVASPKPSGPPRSERERRSGVPAHTANPGR